MPDKTTKCAHPACKCQAPEGENYCSESCKDAADMTEIACNCEHDVCQPL